MAKKKKGKRLHKTLVEQILDKNKIPYKQYEFATHTKDDVAQMEVDHDQVDEHHIYKTLVLSGPTTGPVVGVLPIDEHLDEKKLAKVSGNKSCEMIPVKELLPLTGYIRGGCSPIGMKKHFPTYIHHTAGQFDHIYVSAGQRGLQIRIAPEDLIREARAEVADIIKKDE